MLKPFKNPSFGRFMGIIPSDNAVDRPKLVMKLIMFSLPGNVMKSVPWFQIELFY